MLERGDGTVSEETIVRTPSGEDAVVDDVLEACVAKFKLGSAAPDLTVTIAKGGTPLKASDRVPEAGVLYVKEPGAARAQLPTCSRCGRAILGVSPLVRMRRCGRVSRAEGIRARWL